MSKRTTTGTVAVELCKRLGCILLMCHAFTDRPHICPIIKVISQIKSLTFYAQRNAFISMLQNGHFHDTNGYLFLILTPTEIYLIMTASFELQIERLNPGE